MEYIVYKAPGWHGEPYDPEVMRTDDLDEAQLLGGLRVDHTMPGGSDRHMYYVETEDGTHVDIVDSFLCDRCDEIRPWGDSGPWGLMDGEVLECPEAAEGHLVTWVCDECMDEDAVPSD